jgi:hypothetical protein
MVMGPPYGYERVLEDSAKYQQISDARKFIGWWEIYLRDEGFQTAIRPFLDLYSIPRFGGNVTGLLMMDIPDLKQGHIVAWTRWG